MGAIAAARQSGGIDAEAGFALAGKGARDSALKAALSGHSVASRRSVDSAFPKPSNFRLPRMLKAPRIAPFPAAGDGGRGKRDVQGARLERAPATVDGWFNDAVS